MTANLYGANIYDLRIISIILQNNTTHIVFLQSVKTLPIPPPNRHLMEKRIKHPIFLAVCDNNFVKQIGE